MPLGSRHEEVGLLLEANGQLYLERDGGGSWRLDAPWPARRLLGRRVRVRGVRDGFDLLAVERIADAAAPWPANQPSLIERCRRAVAGAARERR